MPDPTVLPEGCAFAPRCRFCREECRTHKPKVWEKDGHQICCHFADDALARDSRFFEEAEDEGDTGASSGAYAGNAYDAGKEEQHA